MTGTVVAAGIAQVKAGLKSLLPNSGGTVEALMTAFEQEQASELHLLKTSLIDERAGILKKLDSAHAAYTPKQAAADAAVTKAKAALDAAVAARHRTEADYRQVSFPLEQRRDRIQNELTYMVASKIVEFDNATLAEMGAANQQRDEVQDYTWSGNRKTVWSNNADVNARLEALQSLKWRIRDEWHLEPWSIADLDTRFAQALAALPVVPSRPSEGGANAA